MADNVDNIATYQDASDRLVRYLEGNSAAVFDIRTAILEAYEELCGAAEWKHFVRPYAIEVVLPVTGTCSYSASTGQFTIDTGTWPSWAAGATISIGDGRYRIRTRTSSTVLTADASLRPVDDIDALTEFLIFKDIYTLPDNFMEIAEPRTRGSSFWNRYVSPDEWHFQTHTSGATGTSWLHTIMADPYNTGRLALHLAPAPDVHTTINFIAKFHPRRLKRSGARSSEYTGTVSTTGATITGTGTAFTSDMVGSIIRFSENGTEKPDGLGGLVPYQYQRLIDTFSSTTSLTYSGDAFTDVAGRKFVISDPIDVGRSMLPAFWRACELKLCVKKGLPQYSQADREYTKALRIAMEANSVSYMGRSCWDYVDMPRKVQNWVNE
jgi:hypothetical protein